METEAMVMFLRALVTVAVVQGDTIAPLDGGYDNAGRLHATAVRGGHSIFSRGLVIQYTDPMGWMYDLWVAMPEQLVIPWPREQQDRWTFVQAVRDRLNGRAGK